MSDGLVLFLVSLGAATTAFGFWRMVRRIVHTFDAVERAALRTTLAVEVILHQFAHNGGRIEPPLSDEQAKVTATVMDLLLDIRAGVVRTRVLTEAHERDAVTRTQSVIKALRAIR